MYKLLLFICASIISNTSAASQYQVDLILFAHPQNAAVSSTLSSNLPIYDFKQNAISLKPDSKNYRLLKPSQSSLGDEYYLLSRKSPFLVLGHYSWLQPSNNKDPIALPAIDNKGWALQGTVRVRQSNYFLFDSEFQCSPPDNPQSSFTLAQKQRIKPGVVYYLDHPQIGMILKIHK